MPRKKAHYYEHHHEPLASHSEFTRRIILHLGFSGVLIVAALSIGILGYHYFAELDWIDSLLNASMILGGMGPIDSLKTSSAKLFASFYALFSGLVFVLAMGLVLSPLVHRLLHKFHLDEDQE